MEIIKNEFLNKTPVPLLVTRHKIMTTSSAGGLLCGYKPVVLAGSKEPLKIRHVHTAAQPRPDDPLELHRQARFYRI